MVEIAQGEVIALADSLAGHLDIIDNSATLHILVADAEGGELQGGNGTLAILDAGRCEYGQSVVMSEADDVIIGM